MNTRTTVLRLALIALAFASGMVLYPRFPDQVASHWNLAGEADGTLPKFWGVFLLPFIMGGLFLFAYALPAIDPLKKNIVTFRKTYDALWTTLLLFLLYLHGLVLVWNLGYRFHFSVAMIPAFSALLLVIGILLRHTKRNWFMGFRTPWTLSSDRVWEKTHRLGGTLFAASGVFLLLGLPFPSLFLWFLFAPLLLSVLATLIYSYVEFRKPPHERGLP